MTYDGACDGNVESHDGVVRLCRVRNRDTTLDKFPMKIKHESYTTENKHQQRERDQ